MPTIRWVQEARLRAEIRQMKPGSWLYRVLKEELRARGWWRRHAPKQKPVSARAKRQFTRPGAYAPPET